MTSPYNINSIFINFRMTAFYWINSGCFFFFSNERLALLLSTFFTYFQCLIWGYMEFINDIIVRCYAF